jgi:hypothetical protein
MMESILRALSMMFAMGWEILWPLILGFALSAVVQAVVSHREIARLLPDDRPRSIAIALALGAASSSCSYAAVALARALYRKGAHFTAAMAFEMASTNLVFELSIIMLAFLGWQRWPNSSAHRSWSDCWFFSSVGFSIESYWKRQRRRPIEASPVEWKAMPKWICQLAKGVPSGSG